MKVSYQWLAEYVDLSGYTAAQLAEKLTNSGIEVETVESRNQGVTDVVVGQVIKCEQHPNADRLKVCEVDAGLERHLQIVCGAPNVAAGQKVPVALVGAVLPGNFKIKKAKLRGVESEGMICSAKEIGMNDRLLPKQLQEGILVLPEDSTIGESVIELLGLNDEVLELDLTPNRSDCLSMVGVAYEIAAILGREVRLPEFSVEEFERSYDRSKAFQIRIEAPEDCYHYSARLIENVTVAPSPQWMQNRLLAAGIRPINNVVDITNYVMLEYGQPLHAFDADLLQGQCIRVRRAEDNEKIRTLDQNERALDSSMLVIADAERAVAVAGVMGGADSEVNDGTKRILLESAHFSGQSVRSTSKKMGLRSESSLRFEKEVDPNRVIPALNRAAQLMTAYAGGVVANEIFEDRQTVREPVHLTITVERVNRYLGTTLTREEIESIFARLQFETIAVEEEQLEIIVPTRRGDITRDVDLIEEIARLYGYDQIPTTLLDGETTPGHLNKEQQIRRSIRRFLIGQGLNETINYALTDPQKIEDFTGMYQAAKPIKLAMPMSEERSVLRTSLIPHLLDVASYNLNRNERQLALFEIGQMFYTEEASLKSLPTEKPLLAMLLSGQRADVHWSGKSQPIDFYDLKGIVEQLFSSLGMSELVSYQPAQVSGLHPGRTARLMIHTDQGDIEFGYMGQLHPELQRKKDLEETYVLELELEPLYEYAKLDVDYRSLPRYPASGRDIAVVVEETVAVGEMLDTIKQASGVLLESVHVFDVYRGDSVGTNKKSVAFSLLYRSDEKTLTDEEIEEIHGKIVRELEQKYSATLRIA